MKAHVITLLLCLASALCFGQDSLLVEQLLKKGAARASGTSLTLFYAHQLEGTPYVAATLEVNPEERLVVNLREMDCTTFVENVVALTLTTRQGSLTYKDFCLNLTRIRYRGGRLDGYASRNHYFSQWIRSNEGLGIVRELSEPASLFTARQTLSLSYMSSHPSAYPMLKGDAEAQRLIRRYEQECSGETVSYIPKALLNGKREGDLASIQDGDILAIVTSKPGLDIGHVGFAQWGSDGRLHLLNASQLHKKVVLEPMTLYEYLSKHPTMLGVRVIRLL
ncbi:MAG: DUF1460 domain-containing protein [Prevotellaceae bacterium]|nr:DUF1460 domain-containing protein [Prevotellaceae bacterium]